MRSLELPAPGLKLLFRAELQRGQVFDIGETPDGRCEIHSYSSGVFIGERMSGTVLDCSGNWKTIRADGVVLTDAKYMLKTDDGDIITVEASGMSTDKSLQNYRERLFFRTGAPGYRWLNDIVTIGFIKNACKNRLTLEAFAIN